ncbi:MAG: hypothetical protein AAF889_05800 [Cyanobacteria bacterium P01_D01_bin.73]
MPAQPTLKKISGSFSQRSAAPGSVFDSSSPAPDSTAATAQFSGLVTSSTSLGLPLELSPWNQKTYDRLKQSLGLELRRQVFVAVCDDLVVRAHLSQRLTRDRAIATHRGDVISRVVTVTLDPQHPSLQRSIAEGFQQYRQTNRSAPQPYRGHVTESSNIVDPVVQLFGIEQVTRQSANTQRQFLQSLNQLPQQSLPDVGVLILWVPRPWVHSIRQSAPDFWQWHTGLFEFDGDPRSLDSDNAIAPTPQSTFQPNLQPIKSFPWQEGVIASSFSTQVGRGASPTASTRQTARKIELIEVSSPLPNDSDAQSPAGLSPLPNALDAWLVLAQSAQSAPGDRRLMDRAIEIGHQLLTDNFPTLLEQTQIYETLGHCHSARALTLSQEQRRRSGDGHQRAIRQDLQKACDCFQQATQPLRQVLVNPSLEAKGVQVIALLGRRASLLRTLAETRQSLLRYGVPAQKGDELELYQGDIVSAYRQAIASQWSKIRCQRSSAPMNEGDAQWLVQTYNSLGMSYWAQGSGDRTNSPRLEALLRKAIHAYRQGIKRYSNGREAERAVLTPDYQYGTLQTNLGTAYLTLHRSDRNPQWLDLTVTAYHAALNHRDPQQHPAAYAATCNNLGIAHRALGSFAQRQDPHAEWTYCQQAIASYNAALSIESHIPVTFDRATTARQLAQLHQYLARHPLTTASSAMGYGDANSPERHLSAAIHAYSHGLLHLPKSASEQPLLSGLIATVKTMLRGHGMSPQSLLAQIPAQWRSLVLKQL